MADSDFTQGVAESDPAAIDNGFVVTSDGSVLAGVEPPARPSVVVPQQTHTIQGQGQVTNATSGNIAAQSSTAHLFTAEDLEKARKQEKDKLYDDLKEMKATLKETEKQLKERQQNEDAAKAAEEAAATAKAEEEMDLRALMAKRDEEWSQKFEQERQERERIAATLDMERQYTALTQYRSDRVEQEREYIIPQLLDLVTGNTQEEIEQSIASLRQRSEAILGDVQAATAQARQQMPGASVTAPPVGPMETQSTQQSISAEDISNMDMQTYMQNRDRLLGAVKQNVNQRGIYG